MILKLMLKFVVIFSLINSIQCVCRGTQTILDAINESKETCACEDAINELAKIIIRIEEKINSTLNVNPPDPPSKLMLLMNVVTGNSCEELRDNGTVLVPMVYTQ